MREIQILLEYMRHSKRRVVKRKSLFCWFETNSYWTKGRQINLFRQLQTSSVLLLMESGEVIRKEAMKECLVLIQYMQRHNIICLSHENFEQWLVRNGWNEKAKSRLIHQIKRMESITINEHGDVIGRFRK
ncbi:hypothetical protein A5844_000478 [Enterococcus sp. 10A9_DIV0425]|uniref:Uncharacterized protein n=1 Tax=Candidatus Enterococcus wittei TaxID=1987383 RepID=A0A2C9XS58_9ENTE|nr:hypothetical protein [Enterococcus sp. 10A9_DIV0425]OTP12246.1 hypothetical protein A5844_000478 [Enterococcus sp. 10A9_DIV0425]THE13377.1 hypothetical protein E1H99_06235 [Enterococcus hirae]